MMRFLASIINNEFFVNVLLEILTQAVLGDILKIAINKECLLWLIRTLRIAGRIPAEI